MFKTREEIKKELERRIAAANPKDVDVYKAFVRAVEGGCVNTLKQTSVAAIALGFKETIEIQGLVLLDMYLYSVEETAKFEEKERAK